MDNHKLMNIPLNTLKVVGVYHVKISSKHWKFLEYLHKIYSTFVLSYFSLFVLTEVIEMFRTLGEDFFLTVANLGVSLLYGVEIVKIIVSKSTRVLNLIKQIKSTEKDIYDVDADDDTVKEIYEKYVNMSNIVSKCFIFIGVLTITPFYIQPAILEHQNPPDTLYDVVNGTVVYHPRPLPFISYFPFDRYKYYYVSYTLHVIAGTFGASLTVACDILFYSILIYVRSQIAVLQHHLKEFKLYSGLLQKKINCSADEAVDLFVRKCVEDHQVIIAYVKYLDDTMKGLMLLDFGLASMQMAMLGFQIITAGFGVQQFFAAEYLAAMLTQLFLFYWHANEIILESVKVSSAIYESDWFDCSPKIKKSFYFIMMRASKPLTLNAGPFYAMSTSTALSILRAAYSYVALMRQTYIRNKE